MLGHTIKCKVLGVPVKNIEVTESHPHLDYFTRISDVIRGILEKLPATEFQRFQFIKGH